MSAAGIFAPDLLRGQVALVTGGGTGIGLGIASCLAASGAVVVLASRKPEHLGPAAESLRAGGARVSAIPTNVREPESVRSTVERVVEEHGRLDLLVNNAAGNFYAPSASLSPNAWRAVVETDLYGTFYGCQAAYPVMKRQGGGRIVSISMTLHYRGWPQMAHATAAKAGVDALTRTLALEWAADGIRVNAVAPGPIPTEGVRKAFTPPGGGSDVPAMDEYAARAIPLRRWGTPEDIGWMVTYLASPGGRLDHRGHLRGGRGLLAHPDRDLRRGRCSWDTTAWRSRSSGRSPKCRSARSSSRCSSRMCCGAASSCSAGSRCASIPPPARWRRWSSCTIRSRTAWWDRSPGRCAAGALYYSWPTRDTSRHWQAALLVAGAAASHWFLDAIVHFPDLPLGGDGSPQIGFGLWSNLPLTIALELLVLGVGVAVYVIRRSHRHPARPGRLIGLVLLLLALYAASVVGPPPPSETAIAVTDLVGLLALAALAGWVDRRATPEELAAAGLPQR